ncbi:uncharacterized protein LOC111411504 [Olea europaea var. sylvestris]|uniref:uncharacterized protein LOC111411504 n=1 Tax=Olea europaea var. sylvestris TaxID=158386 RepID=UPI000C1D0E25|nr:uncharacterized protein LOC111411504 [Olea europaea var. sylvestris]
MIQNDVKKIAGQQHNRMQKERPISTYCGYSGHAMDRCYKLHTLNPTQYQHLMSMLSFHLKAVKLDLETGTSSGKESGTCFSISINPSFNSSRHWVVDSGATSHLCSDHSAFDILRPIENAFVILPNHVQVPVRLIGNDLTTSRMIGKGERKASLYVIDFGGTIQLLVMGPYHTSAHAGHRFFLTLVDDFKDIVRQFSCVEHLEQNLMVERKHQHLLSVARALFFQSRVPIQFWGDCILTATFLINRTPSKILKNMTPFSLLYGSSFDYSSLRVFGSLCFTSTVPSHMNKFYHRAKACVFFGYPPVIKGYKLYDVSSKSFIVSKDVIFHENHFPFHSLDSTSELIDSFADVVLPHIMPNSYIHHSTSEPSTSVGNDISMESIHLPTIEPFSNSSFDHNKDAQTSDFSQTFHFAPRQTTRVSKPPSYLHEFHCNLLANRVPPVNNSTYPLSNYLSYKPFSQPHRTFLPNVSSEVRTFSFLTVGQTCHIGCLLELPNSFVRPTECIL